MQKQLPVRASLEQLKKQAKAVLKGQKAGEQDALRLIAEFHPRWRGGPDEEIKSAEFKLSDAQLVVANEYGFATWARMKAGVESQEAAPVTEAAVAALREAAGRGNLPRLIALLGANPELINEPGGEGVRTALHQAVFGGSEAAVRLLLERGADPNIRCEGDNAYPLHFAAERQNLGIIRLLIEAGGDPIGEGDYHELGVIGWATAWGNIQAKPEIVEYLLAHGARHNIWSAVAIGDLAAIRELVGKSGELLERRMDMANKRRRPLHLAVVKRQADALAVLLELGANLESLDESGFTALDQAALSGQTELAEMLLEHGAKVRLPAAVALERTRDVERLMQREPDALKPGCRWGTLIVRASESSPGRVIEGLIAAGADVNVVDDPKTAVDSTWGFTALHAAGFNGNRSAAEVLVKHGANVRARESKYHGTPAGWADYAGYTEVRDVILKGKIDMIEAVQYGLREKIAEIAGEDPRALNRRFSEYGLYPRDDAEGWMTPVAYAALRGQVETVRLLLELGAERVVVDPEGKSLYELAAEKGYGEIAGLLRGR